MKAVVIDTNIIFSMLLGKNKKFRDALFSQTDYTFYSPKFMIVELFKYKEKIMRFSSLSEDEVFLIFPGMTQQLHLQISR